MEDGECAGEQDEAEGEGGEQARPFVDFVEGSDQALIVNCEVNDLRSHACSDFGRRACC